MVGQAAVVIPVGTGAGDMVVEAIGNLERFTTRAVNKLMLELRGTRVGGDEESEREEKIASVRLVVSF